MKALLLYCAALVILGCSLFGCVSQKLVTSDSDNKNKISVLTFNVENLFDTDDDTDKDDEAFLPLKLKASPIVQNKCRVANDEGYRQEECLELDWSDRILKRKMARLKDVLAQVNGGHGPDVLILQEVENRHVLELWRSQYLQDMGYQTLIHLEGPDLRGIDTAILSRLPEKAPAKLHVMNYKNFPELAETPQRPTRGLLEGHLELPDKTELVVFAVHFPSQGAPTIHRRVALENVLAHTAELDPKALVIVGGDFNITAKEERAEKYFKHLLQGKFAVSHLIGCGSCVGSTYYPKDKTWSFFDVLLFSPNLTAPEPLSKWSVNPLSIRLVNSSVYQTNRFGSPARFGSGLGSVGVSDHWPMYAELEMRK